MALRLFWRCESTTLNSTHDYSAGDTTASLINNGELNAIAARRSGLGLRRIVSSAGGANFTLTNILPEIIANPASANLSMGFWFSPRTSVYNFSLNTGFRVRGTNADDYIAFSYQPSGSFGFGCKTSSNGVIAIAATAPNDTVTADNWYFMVGRIDIPGDRLTLEVYDANLGLLDANTITDDLANYAPTEFTTGTNGVNTGYGPGGHPYETWHDLFMIGDNYAEPLQKYADFYSYTQLSYNPAARLYANGAFQTHKFTEVSTGLPMKVYSNTEVHLHQLVEVAGAPSKLYANGTYSCPLFIEA